MKQYTLNKLQSSLWNYNKIYPNDPSYNIVVLLSLNGNVDLERFRVIAQTIFDQENIFHTRFIEKDETVYQILDPQLNPQFEIIDLSTNADYETSYSKVVEEAELERAIPFNLETGPLVKARIYKLSSEQNLFFFSVAHIIFDLFSFYEYTDRINQLYNSPFPTEELSEKYKELHNIESENQYLGNEQIVVQSEKAFQYFKNELSGYESLANPSISEKRNNNGCLEGQNKFFYLGADRVQKLHEFAHSIGVSDFSLCLSIYSIFLRKVTNEKKFVIGVPVVNRTYKGSKKILGFFSNMLPVSVDTETESSIQLLSKSFYKKIFSLLRYQNYDLSSFSETTKINTKMNTSFTYYDEGYLFNLNGCEPSTRIHVNAKTAQYGCFCYFQKANDDIKVCIETGETFNGYDLEKCICSIIDQVLLNETYTISDISLMPQETAKEFYNKTNNYTPISSTDSIVSRFRDMAHLYPNNTALSFHSNTMTYQELNALSDKIGTYFAEHYPKADAIAISLECSNELIACILGILKSGKTYVPIDVNAPYSRFEYILLSNNNILLLCNEQKEINNFEGKILTLDELMASINENAVPEKMAAVSPETIAYIIYTSGSTGNPKGVQVTHKNLISLLDATQPLYQFNQNDVWTLFHSYGFDFSVWEIFGCLLSGGKLVVLDPVIRKSPREFYQTLITEKVTILNQTPTAFSGLVREEEYSNLDASQLCLRSVIFGGEALEFASLRTWVKKHPLSDVKLINMYGITETTVHVTYYELTQEDIENESASIIGKPLNNLSLYITNQDQNVLGYNCVGELLISGDGVTLGYRNKPELTSERFITLNLDGVSKLYYRSGDLGLLRPDGNIEYKGRIDNQIQLRGFRIEIGEIQSALLSLPEVQQCAVTLVDFSETDKRLVGYVVSNSAFDEIKLKDALKELIPYYMIPSILLQVPEIPTTINGKTNYNALLHYLKDQRKKQQEDSDTQNTSENMEDIIADMVAEILLNDDFDYDSNLFDIGVNSVHLTELFYKLKNLFHLEQLDMTDMFQYTTINELAQHIQELAE